MNRKENRAALQAYTEPEVVEIEMSVESTILTGSGKDWEVIED